MKKILIACIALAMTTGFYACKKSSDISATNPQSNNVLSAAKVSNIKSGEPVAFALKSSSNSSAAITWKVIPAVGVYKAISGKKATFKFTVAGKYIVTVTDGFVNDSTSVSVDSIPYTGNDTTHYAPIDSSFYPPYIPPVDSTNYHNGSGDSAIAFLSHDQINITPSLVDTGGITSGILMQASTSKQYPSSAATLVSTLGYDSTSGNGFDLNYQGVLLPTGTTAAGISTVANTANFLFTWQDGKYALHIVFNNVTYTGSVTKKGNTYTFTWPYTSGVVISPLVLTK